MTCPFHLYAYIIVILHLICSNFCQLMSQSNRKPQQLEQSEQSRPAFLSCGRFPRPALNQLISKSTFCGDLPVTRGRLQMCLGAAMTSSALPPGVSYHITLLSIGDGVRSDPISIYAATLSRGESIQCIVNACHPYFCD